MRSPLGWSSRGHRRAAARGRSRPGPADRAGLRSARHGRRRPRRSWSAVAHWEAQLDAGLRGAFLCSREAFRTLQMASSAESARARSDVARGWADYFVSTHACRAWLLHEYLHPTRASRATRLVNLMPLLQVGIGARSSTRQ